MESNSGRYEKTHEIRHSLNCFPKEWESRDNDFGCSTIWYVNSTKYVFEETPSGHIRFIAYGVSPDWAITLSME